MGNENKVSLVVFGLHKKSKYEVADYLYEIINKDSRLKDYDIDINIGKRPSDIIEEASGLCNEYNSYKKKYKSVYMERLEVLKGLE